MKSLFWFRNDLRVSDNYALARAIRESEEVIAIYLITPKTWKQHHVAGCKVDFILQNLKQLSKVLWEQKIPLLIRQTQTFDSGVKVLKDLCEAHGINSLYFNYEYPLDERQRDKKIKEVLGEDIDINGEHGNLVLSPGKVLSKEGTPLKVFTPFKKAWIIAAEEHHAWHQTNQSHKMFKQTICPDEVPESITGFSHQLSKIHWKAGEEAAHKNLENFCEESVFKYHQQRDFPDLNATSRLSPYLAIGTISPRQCITMALRAADIPELNLMERNKGVAVWISELIWREFYQHITYFFPEVCKYKPFKSKTNDIPWNDKEEWLTAWQQGLTGFPLVDAAMRQLTTIGWMHNRLRMVVAMFLTKILLLDWRLGEKFFSENLIDGEFSANNGGWQWCASTGTDAVPYFRIFNPTTQSERFDPQGKFIKQYCPELKNLEIKSIHEPYAKNKSYDNLDYPKPIVDYKVQRKKTLEIFKDYN